MPDKLGFYSFDIRVEEKDFSKKVLSFSLPFLLSGLLQMLYSSADMIVIGRFAGDISLAAVSSTVSITNIILFFCIGLSAGCGVVVGINKGKADADSIKDSVVTSFVFSLVFGELVSIAGLCFSNIIVFHMNYPDEIIPMALQYLKMFFWGVPASLLFNMGSSVLRAEGFVSKPTFILAISNFINLILNLVFVAIFNMGVFGVGLASLLCQILSALLILKAVYLKDENRFGKFSLPILKEMTRYGFPSGFQNILLSLSGIFIQSGINRFGANVMAGFSAAHNTSDWIGTVTTSMGQGSAVLLSNFLGAKKELEIRKTFKVSLVYVLIISTFFSIVFFFFGKVFLPLFVSNPESVNAGVLRLKILMPFYIFYCLSDYFANILRGLGKAFVSLLFSFFGFFIIRVLWVKMVFPIFMTQEVLLFSFPVSWLFAFFPLLFAIVTTIKKYKAKNTDCSDQ